MGAFLVTPIWGSRAGLTACGIGDKLYIGVIGSICEVVMLTDHRFFVLCLGILVFCYFWLVGWLVGWLETEVMRGGEVHIIVPGIDGEFYRAPCAARHGDLKACKSE